MALAKDSMTVRSSMFHVLPIENVPLEFSRALCILTLPELRTATMMTRGFLLFGLEVGGGGDCGYAASSVTRRWVMYDSDKAPLVSILEKQLSIILRFSSSYFSARPLLVVGAAEAERGALPS